MRTNKRKITKRNIKRKRTRKQMRRQSKRRQYRQKKYRGGKFNEVQEQRLKDRLREIGFTDEAEMNNIITNIIGSSAQVFADPDGFEQLLHQIETINSPQQFRDWIEGWGNIWDEEVQTDSENTPQ